MSLRTTYLLIFICLFKHYVFSQLSDDFSDGDFIQNPSWSGTVENFTIDDLQQLQLNAPGAGISYLSAPTYLMDKTIWEFNLTMDFNPSSSNYAKFYLVSDNSDLNGPLNGYFVKIGDTADEISLYYQSGTTEIKIIDGADDVVDVSPVNVRVKVIRDENGQWSLFHRNGAGEYQLEGVVTDLNVLSNSYAGVYCEYTSTRANKFFFDDILVDQVRVDSVVVKDSLHIDIWFNQSINQADVEEITNYSIPGLTILSATQQDSVNVILELDPTTSLLTGDYVLAVNSGITYNQPDSIDFNYLKLELTDVLTISDQALEIIFNDTLDPVAAENVSNYSIDNGIGAPVEATLQEDPRHVLLTLNNTFQEAIDYQISISGILNEKQNSSITTSETFNFVIPLVVDSAFAVSSNQVEVVFNKPLNEGTAQEASSFSIDSQTPSSAVIQADGQSVLLTFPFEFSDQGYEVAVVNVEDTDGNLVQTGSSSATFDYLNLYVTETFQVDEASIKIKFNQPLDTSSGETATNYLLTEIGAPSSVNYSSMDSSIVIQFDYLFNTRHFLSVENISNDLLNADISLDSISIDVQVPSAYRSVIINELFPDPTPSVGLPEAEYVELLNRSGHSVQLAGFRLNDEPLPDYILPDGELVVIMDDSDVDLFGNENRVGVASFDALTNSGELVVLKDQFQNTIDSVEYNTGWYGDEVKDDGGYSLERINPNQPCSDQLNWQASTATIGGTPGLQNAVFDDSEDITPPVLVDVQIMSEDSLYVQFDEPILFPEVNALVLDDVVVSAISAISLWEYVVVLDDPLQSEVNNTLQFTSIQDCFGNTADILSHSFYHDWQSPEFEMLTLLSDTEVALKFHEILNEFDAEREIHFLLDGKEVERAILQDTALNRVHVSQAIPFEVGRSYSLSMFGITDTLDNVIDTLNVSFTYEDEVDTVIVNSANVLSLKFSKIPDSVSASSPSKYLLDGEITADEIIADKEDPTWYRLVFESEIQENKVLKLYMEGINTQDGTPMVTPAQPFIYDTRTPTLEELLVVNDSQLVLTFNEAIDISGAISSTHYEWNDSLNPDEVVPLTNRSVRLTFVQKFPEEQPQALRYTGIKDVSGNEVTTNRKEVFVFDKKPPVLTHAYLLNDSTIELRFSEVLDPVASDAHYYLINDTFYPDSTFLQGPENNSIRIISNLELSGEITITSDSISDVNGNISGAQSIIVDPELPVIADFEPLSDSTIRIAFNKSMTSSALNTANYKLKGFEVLETDQLSENEYKLTVADPFNEGDSLCLTLQEIISDTGIPVDSSMYRIYTAYIEKVEILDPKILQLHFGTFFSAVESHQFWIEGNEIVSLVNEPETGQITVLLLDSIPENQTIRLTYTHLTDRYYRTIPANSISLIIDTKAPVVTDVSSDFFSQISIRFSEPVKQNLEGKNQFFEIPELGNPVQVSVMDSTVMLDFDDRLHRDSIYQLIFREVTDFSGNSQRVDTLVFQYEPPAIPSFRSVIFNEIMADPSPVQGLPEVEYLELKNISEKDVNLHALVLEDQSTKFSLPKFVLQPGGFVVIIDENDTGLFQKLPVVGVSGFPSLTNSGEKLELRTVNGHLIDQVTYSREWYGDTERDDGGFSLELVNPFSECPGSVNWQVSDTIIGGTPGTENAVYSLDPDTTKPAVISYELIEDHQLRLIFNEAMDSLSMVLGTLEVKGLTVKSVSVNRPYYDSLIYTFNENLQKGELYDFRLSGALDCSGNRMEPFDFQLGLGRSPNFHDVLITEIMADPDPSVGLPGSEYLELYNATEELISLEGVLLGDRKDSVELPSVIIQGGESLLLVPTSSISDFEVDNKIGVTNWVSLSNQEDHIWLAGDRGVIHQVAYEEGWLEEEKRDGGFSLEMKDLSNPCAGILNWGGSNDQRGGTPGTANSISDQVPDNFGPFLLDAYAVDSANVQFTFNESLYLETPIHSDIQFEPGLEVTSVFQNSLKRTYLDVKLAHEMELNTVYTVSISGIRDCLKNSAGIIQTTVVRPELPDSLDIIINEVLFNPKGDGVDFVELYNNSTSYIDLKEWSISRLREAQIEKDVITMEHLIIAPGAYLAVTEDTLVLKSQYEKTGSLYQVDDLPNFPNEEGTIVLSMPDGGVSDQFTYQDDFHLDLLDDTDGVSLERISANSPTQDPANWYSASSAAGFATPGFPNSQAFEANPSNAELTIEPKVFIPGGGATSHKSFTTINYQLQGTGQFANVLVYNQLGQPVIQLANGMSLATSGFLRWDGTNATGHKVREGYYVVLFEIYDGKGNQETLKETVVVGELR